MQENEKHVERKTAPKTDQTNPADKLLESAITESGKGGEEC